MSTPRSIKQYSDPVVIPGNRTTRKSTTPDPKNTPTKDTSISAFAKPKKDFRPRSSTDGNALMKKIKEEIKDSNEREKERSLIGPEVSYQGIYQQQMGPNKGIGINSDGRLTKNSSAKFRKEFKAVKFSPGEIFLDFYNPDSGDSSKQSVFSVTSALASEHFQGAKIKRKLIGLNNDSKHPLWNSWRVSVIYVPSDYKVVSFTGNQF